MFSVEGSHKNGRRLQRLTAVLIVFLSRRNSCRRRIHQTTPIATRPDCPSARHHWEHWDRKTSWVEKCESEQLSKSKQNQHVQILISLIRERTTNSSCKVIKEGGPLLRPASCGLVVVKKRPEVLYEAAGFKAKGEQKLRSSCPTALKK